ncbi:hypothetical protein [Herbaspirillum sp. VT-16-41]|uniref:hypothetical protein n=1 Tax=Herbaspirillum sp. VT-16-41 TaxID=1953765 RepID=UPI0020C36BC8|nr:hypothetical protein [Herbaspirillum sp. VT-16-41]
MAAPNMNKFADLWLACASHQIEASVELGASTLEYMSKIHDLETNFLRRETGNAILLTKQCVEARTPLEAASMMAERWRVELQESAVFAKQLGELLGDVTVKLNHSMQQRMIEVNKECVSCLHGAGNRRLPGNADMAQFFDKSFQELPGMFGKIMESGKQITEAWSDGLKHVVPQMLAAASVANDHAARKSASKAVNAES